MPSTSTDRLNGLTTSVAVKPPCVTVATSNITLSGLQTINGVTVVEDDRVLLVGQATASQNGIYLASTGTWSRAKDFDGNRDVVSGTRVLVRNTGLDGIEYELTTANPIVIGTTSLTFALRYGANATYDQTAAEIVEGITPTSRSYPEGDVRRYGAAMNGVTDDTTAFQRAWKFKHPYAPPGSTVITGQIPIIANQHAKLDGTIINITGTTLKVFVASVVNDWSLVGPFKVTGDNNSTGSTSGTAAALHITDCNRYYVQALGAIQIKGYGVLIEPGSNTGERGEKGSIHAPQIHGCYIGISAPGFGDGAEYGNVNVPMITRCTLGMQIGSGNINVTGGNIVDNVNGISLVTGGNHAHGIVCGVNINHNQIEVVAEDITLGHTFVSCHIYGGIIHLKDSTGVIFKDCTIDPDEYRFENSNGCGFINCTMPQGNTGTITAHYNTTNSFALWRGCVDLLGAPFKGAAGNIVGIAVSQTLSGNTTITAANVNAVFTVKLDTTGTISANDNTQAAYTIYNGTTGVYTSAGKGDGKLRIRAQFVFTNNAADTGKFIMDCSHSVLGSHYLERISHTTTSTTFTIFMELPTNVSETIQFRIAASSPIANDVSLQAVGTKAYIEGF